ncbi:MAG: amidohydrolase family protein [Candidatus Kryptoniota bacterium]
MISSSVPVKIISGGFVVSGDDNGLAGFNNLVLKGELIIEISKDISHLLRKYPSSSIIDAEGKVIMPAFFNAHYHPEAVIARNFESNLPISQWRSGILHKYEMVLNNQDENFYENMYRAAFCAAVQNGIGGLAFGLIGNEAGVRGMYSALKGVGLVAAVFASNDQQAAILRKMTERDLKRGCLLPFQKDITLFGLSAVARTVTQEIEWIFAHVDETPEDVALMKSSFGKEMIPLMRKSNLLGPRTILLGLENSFHQHLKLAASSGSKAVIIPSRHNVQSFRRVREIFGKYAVGSDWKSPGLFNQMRALLSFDVPASEALAACTKNGVDIFNLSSRIGTIEPGMSAALTFIDSRKFSARSFNKENSDGVLRTIIEDFDDSDVTDLIINGEFVYKERKILIYDMAELIKERDQLTQNVSASLKAATVAEPAEEDGQGAVPPAVRENLPDVGDFQKILEKPGSVKRTFGDEDI